MFHFIFALLSIAPMCERLPESLPTVPHDVAPGWRSACFELGTRAVFHDVDPADVIAVAWFESRLNHAAVGARGETGVLQSMPNYYVQGNCQLDDGICAGLTAWRAKVSRYGMPAAFCRYRGAPAGCASEQLRGSLAARLRNGQ